MCFKTVLKINQELHGWWTKALSKQEGGRVDKNIIKHTKNMVPNDFHKTQYYSKVLYVTPYVSTWINEKEGKKKGVKEFL